MTEFEESIEKIQTYVIDLEQRLVDNIKEKSDLIKQVNLKSDDIDKIKKELKEWRKTLERLIRGV